MDVVTFVSALITEEVAITSCFLKQDGLFLLDSWRTRGQIELYIMYVSILGSNQVYTGACRHAIRGELVHSDVRVGTREFSFGAPNA